MGDDLRPSLLLLMNYGDVNIRDVHDHTELHQAAKYGHAAHVEILLRYRCDIHAVNNNGNTALHIAANNGHAEVAKVLFLQCIGHCVIYSIYKFMYVCLHMF